MRVLFLFTGGTISMKLDDQGAAVPALSGEEVLSFVPGLPDICSAEVQDYGRYPGPHITPQHMWEISELLERELAYPDIDAAVVTHGTDTLEETAYFLDCRHFSEKPIVLVGAMRNSSELSFDGPANLRAAARVATDPASQGRGVLVVLNQLIHAAADVTKADTQALDTFQSPVFGALGIVDTDRILFARDPQLRDPLETDQCELAVDLIHAAAGTDSRLIDASINSGTRGIVIAGTGRGNVPPDMIPGIQRALDADLPVVIASRCPQGRVLDTYGYEGSGRDLRNRGVIFSGLLSPVKARLRLMLALGMTQDVAEVKSLMERVGY